MDNFYAFKKDDDDDDGLKRFMGVTNPRATTIQIVISLVFGLSAFLAFCVLRPRWTGLYAARKRQKDEATALPELPNTMFGWILPLWRITDQQLLASAGLDAYVFLAFFKLAIKFLFTTLLFSLLVIKPVHDAYPEDDDGKHNETKSFNIDLRRSTNPFDSSPGNHTIWDPSNFETDYLWMYLVFAYLFSGIAIYLIYSETRKVIEVRQEYLGTQTTVTDKTLRLSGIPKELQDEERVKEFIENLDIGKVKTVVICRNWKELDKAMVVRADHMRRLEEAYTIHLGFRKVERNLETLPVAQPLPSESADANPSEADENATLIGGYGSHVRPYTKGRPQATIRSGWLGWRRHQVDAIDYYEEKLRLADEQIKELRAKKYAPTPLAFVTMDSVASCQMAIQAVLDPSPLQLIANQSPEPSDVIWPNTYLSRKSRMVRAWSVTALIVLLTIFWSAIFLPIAGLLQTKTLEKVLPQLAELLSEHKNLGSLINTQLPTLFVSLMMVLVPYLYYYLSWYQGEISRGEIELSTISKNFFFTFFNFFVIFTIFGTATKFYTFFKDFGDAVRDPQKIAYSLAISLQTMLNFYVNFIILQGVGLFPFRLLEIGSVSLYPVMLMGAKTPRDYAELVQPPVFSYGFYLPNALLIFIICTVYSVLRSSWQVLLAGWLYFALGHFVYKYQLLYAMDHRQQASGRAWGMICDRIFVGLILFQLTTAGQLGLKNAFARSAMMVPLIIATLWIQNAYGKTYKPLMKFIALSAVKRGEQYTDAEPSSSPDATSVNSSTVSLTHNVWADNNTAQRGGRRQNWRENGELRERNLPFINPSLVAPLRGLWIADDSIRNGGTGVPPEPASEASTP